jgi:hypothetical protein
VIVRVTSLGEILIVSGTFNVAFQAFDQVVEEVPRRQDADGLSLARYGEVTKSLAAKDRQDLFERLSHVDAHHLVRGDVPDRGGFGIEVSGDDPIQ